MNGLIHCVIVEGAKQGMPIYQEIFAALINPSTAFKKEKIFTLVELFVELKTSATYVDAFFEMPTIQKVAKWNSFGYNYKLCQLINKMTDRLS